MCSAPGGNNPNYATDRVTHILKTSNVQLKQNCIKMKSATNIEKRDGRRDNKHENTSRS